ncbi:MAG: precorrin-3B C(17)-methyltransferase [Pseudomonadota bacterium]
MTRPAVICISSSTEELGLKIAKLIDGDVHGLSKRVNRVCSVTFDDTGAHLRTLHKSGTPIIAIMASGAIIRLLANALEDKHQEPAVVSISEDGSSIVPLLGGHHGANDLARKIADALDGHAAITTAGDTRFGVALDQPPAGYTLSNPQHAKGFMADLLAGSPVSIQGEAPWLEASDLAFADDEQHQLIVTHRRTEGNAKTLVYHPAILHVGIGCERGVDPKEVEALVEDVLKENQLAKESLSGIYSIKLKTDEFAIYTLSQSLEVPARFFHKAILEAETPRLANPSETVFNEVGVHGVAEGSALAASGPDGVLIVEKTKSNRATIAIAISSKPIVDLPGQARGRLFVVGIGPGQDAWRSPEVSRMLSEVTDLVGYSLYLDLLGDLAGGKQRHDFDLGREEDRVRHAMELAGEGKTVALVCSGDAGIYAMATLVYELIAKDGVTDAAKRIEVINSPGISALQAAAARAGAPLGHDFCTISLSDLLTPWEDIQRRVHTAGEGDFVIAFYNPVSKKRRTQLAWARDELLKHRPANTPVVLATNLGRDGETVRTVALSDLHVDDVDMLTVVIVGSSNTQTVATGDGQTWVYTPRGYSGKQGTRMQ